MTNSLTREVWWWNYESWQGFNECIGEGSGASDEQ